MTYGWEGGVGMRRGVGRWEKAKRHSDHADNRMESDRQRYRTRSVHKCLFNRANKDVFGEIGFRRNPEPIFTRQGLDASFDTDYARIFSPNTARNGKINGIISAFRTATVDGTDV